MGSNRHRSKRYAIYTRQSTEKLEDFSSCDAQLLTCQQFINNLNDPNLRWAGQDFNDNGYSGATLDRPAMRRLRAAVKRGEIDQVYAAALDRFTRRMRDATILLDELEQAGVELKLVNQAELTSETHNRLLRHILAAFAEFEREMIASRIAETRTFLKKHGRRIAGPAPYGYAADPQTKQLVPIAKEARRARLIFDRAVRRQNPSLIAARINHLKWRTKTWIAKRSGQQRGGGKWTPRQILQLLRNPVYLGQHRDGDNARPGCHPPIVDADVFEKVQAILDSRRTVNQPTRSHRHFPLRGKILCPRCGRPLSTQLGSRRLDGKARLQYPYYSCRSHARGRAPCRGVRYPAHEIEELLRNTLADPATWCRILARTPASATANSLAAVWKALDRRLQDELFSQLIDSVRLRGKNTEMRITFDARCVEILSQATTVS